MRLSEALGQACTLKGSSFPFPDRCCFSAEAWGCSYSLVRPSAESELELGDHSSGPGQGPRLCTVQPQGALPNLLSRAQPWQLLRPLASPCCLRAPWGGIHSMYGKYGLGCPGPRWELLLQTPATFSCEPTGQLGSV